MFVGKRAGLQPWQRESVWRYHRPPFAGRSDAQGNFRADGLPIDVPLDVWLRAEGCNEVLGYPFSAARPATELAALLTGFESRASNAA